jgi:xanthine dehydrogenase accessory factor
MSQSVDGWKMLEKASELAGQGVEFALATVVWRQAPSSGHQGARAIITTDGQIHGWIGGACAEPVVIREAQRAIADRQPRLILLGAPDQFGDLPEGMMFVQMACQSEGALQLYIEPVMPSPHLVVVGQSPMATTLVDLASALGWRAKLVAAGTFAAADIDSTSVVVISTQGHGDEEAVETAVSGRPAFIGLVASSKRGKAVLGYLADRGVAEDLLDQVRVPVGLDLGHTTHAEISVSVLAELVMLKAKGALNPRPLVRAPQVAAQSTVSAAAVAIGSTKFGHHATGPSIAVGDDGSMPGPATAIDLVCGMTVAADKSGRPFEFEGTTYYFCCPGCRAAFEKDPTQYIQNKDLEPHAHQE